MPISPLNAKDHALVAFGHALRAMRKSRGVSQEEIVHLCAIDRSYLGAIERGRAELRFASSGENSCSPQHICGKTDDRRRSVIGNTPAIYGHRPLA